MLSSSVVTLFMVCCFELCFDPRWEWNYSVWDRCKLKILRLFGLLLICDRNSGLKNQQIGCGIIPLIEHQPDTDIHLCVLT